MAESVNKNPKRKNVWTENHIYKKNNNARGYSTTKEHKPETKAPQVSNKKGSSEEPVPPTRKYLKAKHFWKSKSEKSPKKTVKNPACLKRKSDMEKPDKNSNTFDLDKHINKVDAVHKIKPTNVSLIGKLKGICSKNSKKNNIKRSNVPLKDCAKNSLSCISKAKSSPNCYSKKLPKIPKNIPNKELLAQTKPVPSSDILRKDLPEGKRKKNYETTSKTSSLSHKSHEEDPQITSGATIKQTPIARKAIPLHVPSDTKSIRRKLPTTTLISLPNEPSDSIKNSSDLAYCGFPTPLTTELPIEDALNSSQEMEIDRESDIERNDISAEMGILAVVVDTNVLIENIALLEELESKVVNKKRIYIVIPYQALQELDNFKRKNYSKAQNVIKWCNKHFECKDSLIQGQSYQDFLDSSALSENQTGDDKIRSCCLYYMKKGCSVHLLTNDINLKNMAIMAGINVSNANQIKDRLLFPTCDIVERSSSLSNVRPEIMTSSAAISSNNSPHQSMDDDNDDFDRWKIAVHRTLSNILTYVFEDAYGSIWERVIVHKPPWDVTKALLCMEKHWRAVFTDKFPQEVLITVKKLIQLFSESQNYINSINLSQLKRNISLLFQLLKESQYEKYIVQYSAVATTPKVNKPSTSLQYEKSDNIPVSSNNLQDSLSIPSKDQFPIDETQVNQNEKLIEVQELISKVGRHATSTSASMITTLKNLNQSGGYDIRWPKLETLKESLVSLGFSLVAILKDATKESFNGVNEGLRLYWTSNKEPSSFSPISDNVLKAFINNSQGKTFLSLCITEFEKIINNIDSWKTN